MPIQPIAKLVMPVLASGVPHGRLQPAPPMDVLAVFGFLTAFFTLCFALDQRKSRSLVLMTALGLAGLSAYAFLQGAWPLGIVNGVWSAATLGKWRRQRRTVVSTACVRAARKWASEARMTRMFGNN